jgi:hypothetical protein
MGVHLSKADEVHVAGDVGYSIHPGACARNFHATWRDSSSRLITPLEIFFSLHSRKLSGNFYQSQNPFPMSLPLKLHETRGGRRKRDPYGECEKARE